MKRSQILAAIAATPLGAFVLGKQQPVEAAPVLKMAAGELKRPSADEIAANIRAHMAQIGNERLVRIDPNGETIGVIIDSFAAAIAEQFGGTAPESREA